MDSVNRHTFSNDNVLYSVLRLTVPTVIGQIILVLYNIADTFFVSMTGSDIKISAVTVCLPAFMCLSAIGNLFGIGAASVMARALGEGRHDLAKAASAFAVSGCITMTLACAIPEWIFLHPFVRLLGGLDSDVHAQACSYMLITVVSGGVFASLSSVSAHLFRAEGHSFLSAIGVSLGGFLNILLDPLFMFAVLPKGHEVTGAALATALSNLAACLFFLAAYGRLDHTGSILRIKGAKSRMKACGGTQIRREVLRAGLPACLMTMFENISYAVLGHLLAQVSVAAHAGVGVAKKVNMLAHCMVRGMAQGMLPFLAFNYAAGKQERMRRGIRAALVISVSLALLCTTVCLLFPDALIGLFIREEVASRTLGVTFLRIMCTGCPFSACAYLFVSFFQATGNGTKSMVLALLRKGALDIPLMLMAAACCNAALIVAATPAADVVCCLTAICLAVRFFRKQDSLCYNG